MKENTNEILEKIFEAREEELAKITEQDKIVMKEMKRLEKHDLLNKQINQIPKEFLELKKSILKLLDNYITSIDNEGVYFNKKYYIEGFKDAMKLKEEIK